MAPPSCGDGVIATSPGAAQGEPGVLSWEVWLGSATSGNGTLWEDSIGGTAATYALEGATLRLTLSAPEQKTKRRHRFELQQVPPAVSLAAVRLDYAAPPPHGWTRFAAERRRAE
jgi:hypothetical protein